MDSDRLANGVAGPCCRCCSLCAARICLPSANLRISGRRSANFPMPSNARSTAAPALRRFSDRLANGAAGPTILPLSVSEAGPDFPLFFPFFFVFVFSSCSLSPYSSYSAIALASAAISSA
jgi:hypothetical protein